MAKRKAKQPQNAPPVSAQNSAKRAKKNPRGKPFTSENPYKFQSKAENGGEIDPRINVGGRPKGMSDAYKEWLSLVQESDPQKRTNAQLGAVAIGLEMLKGDVSAAREIRAATEGESLKLSGELVLKGYVGITPDEWDADSDTDPGETDAAQAS